MAKQARDSKSGSNTEVEALYNQLGKLSMKVGKQAAVCNTEGEKLQVLQKQANEVATEIEKLNG